MQEAAKITLSPAQFEVAHTRGCHVQVIACAGSGKTESVSRRVAALIAEGVKSDEIVAFTFTDRAATELKERIVKRVAELVGEDAAGRLAHAAGGMPAGAAVVVTGNTMGESRDGAFATPSDGSTRPT